MVGTRWQPWFSAFAGLLLLVPPSEVSPQELPVPTRITVTGQVVDLSTGRPLPNAVIRIPELGVQAISDSGGLFQLGDVEPGVFKMTIRCLGYQDLAGDLSVVREGSFQVGLSPVEMDPDAEPGRIVGRVMAREDSDPIPDAEVSLLDLGLRKTANQNGWFEFPEVPPGIHVLRTTFLGRETREDSVFLNQHQVLEVDLHLGVEPIPLEGITVTAFPRWLVSGGFIRRRGRGYEGRQWTRAELEALDPTFLQDVITDVPGIRDMGASGIYGRRGCKVTIFVDDVEMDDFFDLDYLDPRNIEALEVYHGDGKPGEFFWYCGVILVWLKH